MPTLPCLRRGGGKTRLPMMTDPYAVLGVSPTASQDEITHAYRRELRANHPDLRPADSNSGADERLRQILAAYALLRDPRRRSDYDRTYLAHKGEPYVAHKRSPRVTHNSAPPVEVPVVNIGFPDRRPPLRVGPVRWHR
ncbi:dnaJ domain protein [Mycobacterium xenopi 3993]|nr:dnaJ domain protein [Mycobacterium xenopi 3993]